MKQGAVCPLSYPLGNEGVQVGTLALVLVQLLDDLRLDGRPLGDELLVFLVPTTFVPHTPDLHVLALWPSAS